MFSTSHITSIDFQDTGKQSILPIQDPVIKTI